MYKAFQIAKLIFTAKLVFSQKGPFCFKLGVAVKVGDTFFYVSPVLRTKAITFESWYAYSEMGIRGVLTMFATKFVFVYYVLTTVQRGE